MGRVGTVTLCFYESVEFRFDDDDANNKKNKKNKKIKIKIIIIITIIIIVIIIMEIVCALNWLFTAHGAYKNGRDKLKERIIYPV